MSEVIEIQDLVKVYPDGTEALKGITFDIKEGEFFGFLGPNGAGKSTTIRIITTLLPRTSGDVHVLGYDVATHPNEVRVRIGYAAQEVGIDDELTGRENLMLQGRLYHVDEKTLKQRVEELLDITDLTGRRRPALWQLLWRHAQAARPGHRPGTPSTDTVSRRADNGA